MELRVVDQLVVVVVVESGGGNSSGSSKLPKNHPGNRTDPE